MDSTEPTNDLSSQIEAKKDCLEKAKKILLLEECKNINFGNENSQKFIHSLANLQDSLREVLSESLQTRPESSSTVTLSPIEQAYRHFHYLRLSLVKVDRNEHTPNVDEDSVMKLLGLEADLYRAMWLNCLILISAINSSSPDNCNHKRKRRELENSTSDSIKSKKDVLQRTIRQCRFLVRTLAQIKLRQESGANRDHQNILNNESYHKNVWDACIAEWTNKNNDCDDEKENPLNILSFTKEQLEMEEQELLCMATTPIPSSQTYNKLQPPTFNGHSGNENVIVKMNRLLKGRLLADATETTLHPVTIELDEWGILRATAREPIGGNKIVDSEGGIHWQWSLTSESVVTCNYDKSPNKIQINNVISFQRANLTTISLDVGVDGKIWQDQVSRIQKSTNIHDRCKIIEEQREIKKLWPMKEVIAIQIKARELFLSSTIVTTPTNQTRWAQEKIE